MLQPATSKIFFLLFYSNIFFKIKTRIKRSFNGPLSHFSNFQHKSSWYIFFHFLFFAKFYFFFHCIFYFFFQNFLNFLIFIFFLFYINRWSKIITWFLWYDESRSRSSFLWVKTRIKSTWKISYSGIIDYRWTFSVQKFFFLIFFLILKIDRVILRRGRNMWRWLNQSKLLGVKWKFLVLFMCQENVNKIFFFGLKEFSQNCLKCLALLLF